MAEVLRVTIDWASVQGARHSAASATATETEVRFTSEFTHAQHRSHLSVCAPADAPPGQQRSDAVL